VAALILYVLSAGPVGGYFIQNNPRPNPVIFVVVQIVYAPISLAAYFSPPFRKAMEQYSDYFCPRLDDADSGP
jgi:hypothetical protein